MFHTASTQRSPPVVCGEHHIACRYVALCNVPRVVRVDPSSPARYVWYLDKHRPSFCVTCYAMLVKTQIRRHAPRWKTKRFIVNRSCVIHRYPGDNQPGHGVVWDGAIKCHEERQSLEARPSREALHRYRRKRRARVRDRTGAGEDGGEGHSRLQERREGKSSRREATSRSSRKTRQGGRASHAMIYHVVCRKKKN